jgi:hypothetical protein
MTQLAGARSDGGRTVTTVLDRLSPAVMARLATQLTPARYGPGETILRDGADTPFLGVIESGR